MIFPLYDLPRRRLRSALCSMPCATELRTRWHEADRRSMLNDVVCQARFRSRKDSSSTRLPVDVRGIANRARQIANTACRSGPFAAAVISSCRVVRPGFCEFVDIAFHGAPMKPFQLRKHFVSRPLKFPPIDRDRILTSS